MSTTTRKTRRPTFDISVKNLPTNITQRDIEKKFTQYGEIASLFVRRNTGGVISSVTVRYLCEPDAVKAENENNDTMWNGHKISVNRFQGKGNRNQNKPSDWKGTRGGHMPMMQPFFKPMEVLNTPLLPTPPNMCINPYSLYGPSNYDVFPPVPPIPLQPPPNLGMDIREIVCTYVEDCVSFYGQHTWETTALDALSTRLQMLCPVLPRLHHFPSFKPMYGTIFSNDSLWYRCKVVSNSQPSGKILIQYIDYGNFEEVEFKNMVELPESLSNPPPFGAKCVLSSYEPANSEKLCNKGVKYLQELILGRTLLISTFSPLRSPTYEVTECKLNQQFDVIQDLLLKKFIKNKIKISKFRPPECNFSSPQGNNNVEFPDQKVRKYFPKQHTPPMSKSPNKPSTKVFSEKVENYETKSEGKTTITKLENEILRKEIECLKENIKKSEQKTKLLEEKLEGMEQQQSKNNTMKKLESVASHIQFVKSLRCNLPKNDPDISNVLSTLLYINSSSSEQKAQLKEKVEETVETYENLLNEIRQCSDRMELDDLIKKKNSCKDYLCENLRKYEEVITFSKTTADNDISASVLQDMIDKLKAKVKSAADISLNNKPSSIDDVMLEYNATMIEKRDLDTKVREVTDKALAEFHLLFSEDFLKLFSLAPDPSNEDSAIVNLSSLSPEKFFSSEKFKKTLTSLQSALDEEVSSVYSHCDWKKDKSEDQKSKCTLIECLLDELQNVLTNRNKDEILTEKYEALLESLSEANPECQSKLNKVDELLELKQSIKASKSQLRHAMVDLKDFEEDSTATLEEILKIRFKVSDMQNALHEKFVEEERLLANIVQLYTSNYPEYDHLYPEFCLSTYVKYDKLYKLSWSLENFNIQKTMKRGENNCYYCTFAGDPVTIKEMYVDKEKQDVFFRKVMKWNSLCSELLVPVKAVFQSSSQMYIMCPKRETLEEQALSFDKSTFCDILINVLQSLKILHNVNIVHGMVEAPSVLVVDGKASLDFYFKSKPSASSSTEAAFKKKHPVESKPNDIFDFGCLLLALLFPDLRIPYTCGVPDIFVHRKTIEKDLSSKGYNILTYSILSKNTNDRPTADELVNGPFLQCLMKIKHSKPDKVETIQCPIPPPVSQESKPIPELVSLDIEPSSPSDSSSSSSSDNGPVLILPTFTEPIIKEPVPLNSQINLSMPDSHIQTTMEDDRDQNSNVVEDEDNTSELQDSVLNLPLSYDDSCLTEAVSLQSNKTELNNDCTESNDACDNSPSEPVESASADTSSEVQGTALAKLLSLRQSFSKANESLSCDTKDEHIE